MNAYLIPECNLAEFESRVEQLNRRAKRLGLAPITVAKTVDHIKARTRSVTVTGETSWGWDLPENIPALNAKWPCEDTGVRQAWWRVEVSGEKPTLNGWTFTAILEPLTTESGEVLNLISALPGETCPEQYRDCVGQCDHCKTKRIRNQTFVVRNNETGEYKVVGRQCIKDFLGYHADPHQLAAAAELLAQLALVCGQAEDEGMWGYGGGGSSPQAWDLQRFLAITSSRIRLFGWVSRTKARDSYELTATADVVLSILTPPHPAAEERAREEHAKMVEAHPVTEADTQAAQAAVEWAKDIPENERTDYLGNVNLVARVGYVNRKTAGVAASIMVAYAKATEQEVERQRLAARPESNYVGEEGKRIPYLKVTCNRVIMHENNYDGVTGIHKLTDEAGNDLVWFASAGEVIRQGETVWVAASVKRHEEFRDRRQTQLTRVVVLTDEEVVKLQAKAERKAARLAKRHALEAAKVVG